MTMKIVFMGTPGFASAILEDLLGSDHEILAVVTGMDKPVGRRRVMTPTEVRLLADKHELPVMMPKTLKSKKLHAELAALEADLFVVAAFRILPPELFELPKLGAINIHGSLLPKYRGAAPINWAIINGEKETGLTSFFLQQQVDTGDMILQAKTDIAPTDTYDSLHERLATMAGPFCLETLKLIEQGPPSLLRQDDTQSCPAPKIGPADALIEFDQPSKLVANFIRGMATKPGAYSFFRGKKCKVHLAKPAEAGFDPAETGFDPVETGFQDEAGTGTVIPHRKKLLVKCRQSVVELLRVVPAGKKEMDGGSFINGFRPEAGESFEKI